jgi:hypothetical protein
MEDLGTFFESIGATTWISMAIALLCLALFLAVVARMFNYVSRTALVHMVDQYELSGVKVSWRQGFRLGWSRAAWHLFLIDLVIYLPLVIIGLVMILGPALPLIATGIINREPTMVGVIFTIGFAFVGIFLLIILALIASIFIKIIQRECILGDKGVIDSIRDGWELVLENFVDVFLMWLIILGINIGFFFVIIPLVLLLVGVGLLIGSGAGLLSYAILAAASANLTAIIAGIVVGLSLFILVIAVPITFFDGLRETFLGSIWTLAYRELSPAVPQDESLIEDAASPAAA